MRDVIANRRRVRDIVRRLPIAAVLSRFAVAGAGVAVVYFSLVGTMALAGVPIQVAVAVSYVICLTIHFTLNRQWVFASDGGYAFHITGQGAGYLVSAALSYSLTATGVALLPDALDISELAAFLLTSVAVTGVTFPLLRLWIFRSARTASPDGPA